MKIQNSRRLLVSSIPFALPIALWAAGIASIFAGCKAIQSGAGALADATAGSSVSNVFRGVQLAAEASQTYTPSQEHYIGRSVAAEILARYKVHDDPALTEYVNMVGLGVALSSPDVLQTFTGYHFTILESEEVNAVSTPGGFVFVTLGTVKRAKSEDELAAVLAHEIAHVTLHHGIAAIKSATRKKSAALLVQGAADTAAAASKKNGSGQGPNLVELTGLFASAIQDITSDLLVKGYSRETELDADHVGAKFLKQAGYSRTALASYLQRLGSEAGKGGWYGTHPTPKDRIAALGDVSKDDTSAVLAGLPARNQRFKAAVGA